MRLVDINETPIERITPSGLRTSAEDFAFDVLIYATGFDGVTGPYDRIDIVGPGGWRLRDDWTGMPRTFLGMLAGGFPNMLIVLGPHTARGNIPRNIEEIVDWPTGLLAHMQTHGLRRVETRRSLDALGPARSTFRRRLPGGRGLMALATISRTNRGSGAAPTYGPIGRRMTTP